jgi:hypothetical protein
MDFPIDDAYNSLFLLKIKNKKLFDGSGIFLEPVLLLRPCQNLSLIFCCRLIIYAHGRLGNDSNKRNHWSRLITS